MSEKENSSNNQLPPSSPSTATSRTVLLAPDTQLPASIQKDRRFYYDDGNIIFLVENTLFKVHASRLAGEVENYEFKHIIKAATGDPEGDADRPGTSDGHPIVLPDDVTKLAFGDFLMVAFGGVTDDNFLEFLQTLKTPSRYNLSLAFQLTKIGYLGCRFGMKRLDTWAQSQIYTVLQELITGRWFAGYWVHGNFLLLVRYIQAANTSPYRTKTLNRMRNIMSARIKRAYDRNNEMPQGGMVDACADLYTHKDILITSPGFFGFIFAVVVSLGPQSPIWTDSFTREDRRVLYAAYALFTRLANHTDLEVGWVIDPTPIKEVCPRCEAGFNDSWSSSFSQCQGLASRIPSEDMRHIVSLPEYQNHFWVASKTAPCKCASKMADKIEERIDAVFCAFTERYKLLVQTV